jgi:MarR family transcriptional regulator, organic hydroperoxide resistance regulator
VAGQTLQSYLVYLLSEAERRVNRQLAEQFRDEGVPVEYWRILQALADGHGHSMGELADAVLMNHPTLTKTLDRMVSEALVYRRQSTDDRRRIAIYAATSGQALLRLCVPKTSSALPQPAVSGPSSPCDDLRSCVYACST